MNELPVEVMQYVSPDSVRLQKLIKVTMLLLLINSGLQSGASVIGLKLVGELFAAGEAWSNFGILLLLSIYMTGSTAS